MLPYGTRRSNGQPFRWVPRLRLYMRPATYGLRHLGSVQQAPIHIWASLQSLVRDGLDVVAAFSDERLRGNPPHAEIVSVLPLSLKTRMGVRCGPFRGLTIREGQNGGAERTQANESHAFGLEPAESYLEEPLYSEAEQEKAWSDAARTVKTYNDEFVVRWNAEIDTYLVFAGLFSAILTAFNVQSYPLLQPPSPDPSIAILSQISLQFSIFTNQPPYTNSTYPAFASALPGTAPQAPTSLFWINTLWFSSLIVSISSAFLRITVKQWLHEHKSGLFGDSLELVELRRYRLNKSGQVARRAFRHRDPHSAATCPRHVSPWTCDLALDSPSHHCSLRPCPSLDVCRLCCDNLCPSPDNPGLRLPVSADTRLVYGMESYPASSQGSTPVCPTLL
ncbi:hypothetical protein NUW54_g8715 [Trametes sanguinea]|uniref:Uncharacterized protein n=1 Tax=Trametes sanguinea TaxID=158606 RepID=A0ACC1PCN3_9APHY|nr:hypothetical protein NUW54_g8715 [Trametes sanguinea]